MKSDKQKAIEAALCALEGSESTIGAIVRLKAAAKRVDLGAGATRFAHAVEEAAEKMMSANNALGLALIALKNANV